LDVGKKVAKYKFRDSTPENWIAGNDFKVKRCSKDYEKAWG
jgi:hypothetical protein